MRMCTYIEFPNPPIVFRGRDGLWLLGFRECTCSAHLKTPCFVESFQGVRTPVTDLEVLGEASDAQLTLLICWLVAVL